MVVLKLCWIVATFYTIANGEVPESWFTQKVNHFNPADFLFKPCLGQCTSEERYYVNDTSYKAGGPAFLFIGPEMPLTEIYARTGSWLEYAKTYHAIGFALEQRDLSTANLKYLTVEQALEDMATFIRVINKKYNTRWITFGGSYAGLLSAWMRYKFPHLVSGAVAYSAPLDVPMVAPDVGHVPDMFSSSPLDNASLKVPVVGSSNTLDNGPRHIISL